MSELVKKEQSNVIATPAVLLEMAVQQNADIDKLSKLMELQERWEANEARKAYTIAMARFREDCPAIDKTREAHNSKYAGLAETIKQIRNAMSDNGLSHSWVTKQDGEAISVTCCITHVMGHSECTSMTAPPDKTGSKNTIQAIGSTVTYLERYTLFAILGLASQDEDTDGNLPIDYISPEQAANIRALIEEVKANEINFLKWLKADSIEHIQASAYDVCVKQLEAKRK